MKKLALFLGLSLAHVSAAALTKIEGTVTAIDLNQNTYAIEAHDNGKLYNLEFKDITSIRLNNRKYRDLSVLSVGDTVIYKQKQKAQEKTFINATISNVDKENMRVTFIDKDGNSRTLRFSEDARLVRGFIKTSISNLRAGDKVQLELSKVKGDKKDSLALAN